MARIYANESFPRQVAEELRRLGHDVLTVQESGKGGQSLPDEEVLSFAIREHRCLVTMNRRHFIRLHDRFPSHSGIIVCSFDPDFAGLAGRIHEAIQRLSDLAGRLIRIERTL